MCPESSSRCAAGDDTNDGCAGWAAAGECGSNPGYMAGNCCASCECKRGFHIARLGHLDSLGQLLAGQLKEDGSNRSETTPCIFETDERAGAGEDVVFDDTEADVPSTALAVALWSFVLFVTVCYTCGSAVMLFKIKCCGVGDKPDTQP